MTLETDIYRPCALRIDIGGEHKGSGFFAAPGKVVTCWHVVRDVHLVTQAPIIEAVDSLDRIYAAELGAVSEDDDLAILELRPAPPHPCVLLDASPIAEREQLHLFAYSILHPEGVPRSPVSEGATGGAAPRLSFEGAQIQPGMSGGALLNVRTGAVCGIVQLTRDEDQALGGYAIPVARLFALDASLQGSNEAYHERYRAWRRALTPEQEARQAGRRARLADTVGGHFVVTLSRAGDGWQVASTVYPAGASLTAVDVDLTAVRRKVARLFRDWPDRKRYQEREQIRTLGEILYSAVFPGDVGARLLEALETASARSRVLVSLRFDDDVDQDLMQLPWEHLCLPGGGDETRFLARDDRVCFARAIEALPEPAASAPDTTRLPMVVVGTPPRERAADGGPTAVEKIVDALELTLRTCRLEPAKPPLRSPDVMDVRARLAEAPNAPVILHYVGFGCFKDNQDMIAMGDDSGGIELVSADDFADGLNPLPRVVVLQLADGERGDIAADFSALAPTLLARGVEVVVACQYPMSAQHAVGFNDGLYAALASGAAIEVAVQLARAKLRFDSRSFLSPAIFLRSPGVRVLTLPGPRDSGSAPQQPGAYASAASRG